MTLSLQLGRRRVQRGVLSAVLCASAACGASRPGPADLAARLAEDPALEKAATVAPDLVALARAAASASRDADARGDGLAAEEHSTEARLYADAALFAADTDALRTELARLETSERAALLRVQVLEDEARLRQDLAARCAAQALALAESEKAFALAAEAETKRFRGNAPEVRADAAAAAEILRRRARLIALAARALAAGGPASGQLAAGQPDAADEVLTAIDAARLDGDRRRALLLADGLVARAMRLLGDVRRDHASPPEAEKRSLAEAAKAYGFAVEARPEGLRVAPTAPGKAALARLATLIAAHPNGAVMILGRAQDFRAIEAQLQRAGTTHGPLTHVDGKDLAVVFAAYAAVP